MKRFLLLALLLSSACSKNVTEVALTIDAQSQVRSMAGSVHVVVRGGPASGTSYDDPPALDVDIPVGAGASRSFPLQITVAPQSGDAGRRWLVEASAVQAGTSTVLATARVRGNYVNERTLRIGLVLEDACLGVPCNADQTCRGGVCVDSTYVPGADAGVPSDAGVDSAIPPNCPGADVFTPDPDAGTLRDDGGVPFTYPALEACNVTHPRGLACPSATHPDDVCYTERQQEGFAFCRVPCSIADPDGGPDTRDEARCQQIHSDSHCEFAAGFGNDYDGFFCTVPCNPIDDVGCPSGTHCMLFDSSDTNRVYTSCWALDVNPRHQLEPCGIVDGASQPVLNGCAAGYTCTWESFCGVPSNQGYACVQLCDADPYAPRVACPSGSTCAAIGGSGYPNVIGGMEFGVCRPN